MGKNKNRLFDQTRLTKGIPVRAITENVYEISKEVPVGEPKDSYPLKFSIPFEVKYITIWIIVIILLHVLFN